MPRTIGVSWRQYCSRIETISQHRFCASDAKNDELSHGNAGRSHRSPALGGPARRARRSCSGPGLEPLADEIIDAIRASIPAYDAAAARRVRRGLPARRLPRRWSSSSSCSSTPGAGAAGPEHVRRRSGGGEAREGRTLESLLSAYRIGARLAWRKIADEGREVGPRRRHARAARRGDLRLHRRAVGRLREGWAEERSAAAGEIERRRAALVGLLTQSPPAGAGGGRGGRARGGLGAAGASSR